MAKSFIKFCLKIFIFVLLLIFAVIHIGSAIFTEIYQKSLQANIKNEFQNFSDAAISLGTVEAHLLSGLKINNVSFLDKDKNFIFIKKLYLRHKILPLFKKQSVYTKIQCIDSTIFFSRTNKTDEGLLKIARFSLPMSGKSPYFLSWKIENPELILKNTTCHYADFTTEHIVRMLLVNSNFQLSITNNFYPLKLKINARIPSKENTTININAIFKSPNLVNSYVAITANALPVDYIKAYLRDTPLQGGSVDLDTYLAVDKNAKAVSSGKIVLNDTFFQSKYTFGPGVKLYDLPLNYNVRAHYDKNALHFDKAHFNINKLIFNLAGSIYNQKNSPVYLRLDLWAVKQSLNPLQLILPQSDISGIIESNLHIIGPLNDIKLSGNLRLKDFNFTDKTKSLNLENLNSDIRIENNTGYFDNMALFLNKILIEAKGQINIKEPAIIADANIYPPLNIQEPVKTLRIRSHLKAVIRDRLYGNISFIARVFTNNNAIHRIILDFRDLYYPELALLQGKNTFAFKKFTINYFNEKQKQPIQHLDFKDLSFEAYSKDNNFLIDKIKISGYQGNVFGFFSFKTDAVPSEVIGCLTIKDMETMSLLKVFYPEPLIQGLLSATIRVNFAKLTCEGFVQLLKGTFPAKGPMLLISQSLNIPLEQIPIKIARLAFDIKNSCLYINNFDIDSNKLSVNANLSMDKKENITGKIRVKFAPQLLKKSPKMQAIALILGEKIENLEFLFKLAGSFNNPRIELVRENLKQNVNLLVDVLTLGGRERAEKQIESALDTVFK